MFIKIKFISIMQKYSGKRKEVEVDLPCSPEQAIDHIISRFQIPWEGNLEKYVRIFINRELSREFILNGKKIKKGETIAFIPMSGGG